MTVSERGRRSSHRGHGWATAERRPPKKTALTRMRGETLTGGLKSRTIAESRQSILIKMLRGQRRWTSNRLRRDKILTQMQARRSRKWRTEQRTYSRVSTRTGIVINAIQKNIFGDAYQPNFRPYGRTSVAAVTRPRLTSHHIAAPTM